MLVNVKRNEMFEPTPLENPKPENFLEVRRKEGNFFYLYIIFWMYFNIDVTKIIC